MRKTNNKQIIPMLCRNIHILLRCTVATGVCLIKRRQEGVNRLGQYYWLRLRSSGLRSRDFGLHLAERLLLQFVMLLLV
jgi:hypothetical protein